MIPKKTMVILVAIAIVLAVTAISMSALESDEIPTKSESNNVEDSGSGKVGIDVKPASIEDKNTSGGQA